MLTHSLNTVSMDKIPTQPKLARLCAWLTCKPNTEMDTFILSNKAALDEHARKQKRIKTTAGVLGSLATFLFLGSASIKVYVYHSIGGLPFSWDCLKPSELFKVLIS